MILYSDIADRVAAGETDEQIATALAADFRTNEDIDIARLMGELLIPSGVYANIEGAKDTNAAAKQLYDLVNERRISTIRTASNAATAGNIRSGLDGLRAASLLGTNPDAIENAFYGIGSGLRFRNADGTKPVATDIANIKSAEAERVRLQKQRSDGEAAWQAWLDVHHAGGTDTAAWDAFAAAKPVVV